MTDEGALKKAALSALRNEIDAVDTQIHDLLIERANLVLKVSEIKEKDQNPVFYRPEREAQIHRRLAERHHGALPVTAVHRIFREIISASLNLEKPLQIAYLGPEATFTHQAALKHFGSSCTMYPVNSIGEVFDEVETGRTHFGVVPVEDSTEGFITHTLDRFVDTTLRICAENLLPLVHNLLSTETSVDMLRVVYGHFQALEQCRGWLDRNLADVRIVKVESTAKAAEYALREAGAAAIGGLYAADRYGLNILAEHIEDHDDIAIRSLIIGRQEPPPPSGLDKTSIVLSFRDQAGLLHKLLGSFARRGINLTRIESRPTKRRAWDYLFFIDFEGHQADEPVAAALADVESVPGTFIKILGSYPRGEL